MDEGPRRGDLLNVGLGSDFERKILGEASIRADLRAGNTKPLMREDRHDGAAIGLQMNRVAWLKGSSKSLLIHNACLLDEGRVGGSAAISDGGLVGVHLDECIVDPEACKGGEDVLDSLYLGAPLNKRRGPFDGLHMLN